MPKYPQTCTARMTFLLLVALLTVITLLSASSAEAKTVVSLWFHAGQGVERDSIAASVEAFNSTNQNIQIKLIEHPEGSYSEHVNAAAAADKLPCLLDFDGPNVYDYASANRLISLERFDFIREIKYDFFSTIVNQGTYNGKLYSLGQFDSGLAIWGNRKLLTSAGIKIPKSLDEAWTLSEFENALRALKKNGVPYPLDMKFNYDLPSWTTFGFAPILQSFGGDLVNRRTYKSAQGVLNGPQAIKSMRVIQKWAANKWINPGATSDNDFVEGKSALSYVGHWTYVPYKKALGKDLVLIPMPKFGSRVVTGAGSWNWGISRNCQTPEAAARVLHFLLSKEEILRMTKANGAMPSRLSAIAASDYYGPNGPLSLYVMQIRQGMAIVRPQTPAFSVISSAFHGAVTKILNGSNPKTELDNAVKKIDLHIAELGASQ